MLNRWNFLKTGFYEGIKLVPYVAEDCNIRYGFLISTLSLAGDVTTKPDSHTVWFVGGIPCDQNGNSLEDSLVAGHRQELDNGLVADYLFSRKPAAGYSDYYHKMTKHWHHRHQLLFQPDLHQPRGQ